MSTSITRLACVLAALSTSVAASGNPAAPSGNNPVLKNSTLLGVALDPSLNRDACGSVAWADRILWVCRDTQMVYPNGTINSNLGVWDGSASFSNMTAAGPPFEPIPADGSVPDNAGFSDELPLYGGKFGTPFYVLSDEFCGNNTAGRCPNGDRYPRSPDSPPLVTSGNATAITAYTWVKNKLHDDNTDVIPNPSTALYKVTWSPAVEGADSDTLPKTQFVNATFFAENAFAYGAAGNVIVNGTAFLWAQNFVGNTSLARVALTGIEDIRQYEYYVSGAWTKTMPSSVNDTAAYLDCTEGGQGTFYYSDAWSCFVWIGGDVHETNGQFYVSTAPAPEGPWTTPEHFLTVPLGTYQGIGAYGFQAHPDLVVNKSSSDMYITYTKKNDDQGYQTPVYLLEWDAY